MATVSLGTNHVAGGAAAVTVIRLESVDKLFRIGWHLLFRDIVMPAARAVEQQLKTSGAAPQARELGAAIKNGKPWSALPGIRALCLENAEVSTLLALSDECPSLRHLLAQARDSMCELAFVANRSQLQAVGDFLATR